MTDPTEVAWFTCGRCRSFRGRSVEEVLQHGTLCSGDRPLTELERAAAACYLIVARERATLEHFRKIGASHADQRRIAEGIKRAEECADAIMALR